MKSYDLVEFGKPMQARDLPDPEPVGTEVLVRVRRCGVCHSDLHLRQGYFDLGEDGEFRVADRGMKLPLALGHEVLGEVVAAGPDAPDAPIGETMLVHPWIGCGDCRHCLDGRENDCAKMNPIGILRAGGYASHVIVPHPKFLVDVSGLDLSEVTPYACSGVTVFNALKKALPVAEDEALAVIGAGGLGLNAVALAKAMDVPRVISVDVDDAKLAVAAEMGADATLNSGGAEDPVAALQELAGGKLLAVVDTVGMPATARLGVSSLAKLGRYVLVGLYGGTMKVPMPWLPQRALTLRGSYVGSVRDLRELIDLVRTGKVKSLPTSERPLSDVNEALDDLEAGRVTGRLVLTTD
ncbi:alcohol dehydrogenase catalytic domain-containing protein [Rhodobacteraceae bacterium NNCM2]|nr:alcohol dehydrogenase catalytic domain-containing protein [Coraliihabitans acroporae]